MANNSDSSPRRWIVLLLIGVCVAVVVGILRWTPPFQTLEHNMRDQLFKIRGPQSLSDTPILLVTISQQADEEIPYRWPWPRNLYGHLVDNLNDAGVEAIGIDVMLDQSGDNPSNDTLLARSLKEHGNVVLAGRISREARRHGEGGGSQEIKKVEPTPILKRYNPNPFGVVTNTLDNDGVLRRYLLYENFMKQRYYGLGLETLRIYKGFSRKQAEVDSKKLTWGAFDIPLAHLQSMYINYYGPSGSFPSLSFEKVIDDSSFQTNFEREAFPINEYYNLRERGVLEDKVVLIGSTMPEEHDFHITPFSAGGGSAMPGVEVHANALQTILDQNFLYVLPKGWELVMILIIALSLVWLTRKTNLWVSSTLLFLLLTGYLVLGIWLFVSYNYIMAFTGPMSAALLGFASTLGYDYIMEQREKQRIKGMFQSYVSPALVEDMVESGEEPSLGGEKEYITAFFSDIQAFSTISEQLDATRLVRLINDYLSAMTNIVNEQGGTLDKYIGDAIVAFYGAPLYFEDHAYRACVTSQLMQREMEKLCRKWKEDEEDWPDMIYNMKNRIGINTGDMVTGNMGSQRRFNYTMMGDHVNLAARCEGAAKKYGIYTMTTEYTKEQAEQYGDRCVFRFLDKIVVKGKTKPVDVYEIVDLKDGITDEDRRCIDVFEKGFRFYLKQEWDQAIECFEISLPLERNQPDKENVPTNPSEVMLERCRNLKRQPPGEDWNGVYVMTSK